jgi:outer membrane lipoprotein-sorting protein
MSRYRSSAVRLCTCALAGAVCAIVIAGCSAFERTAVKMDSTGPEVIQKVNARAAGVKTLRASGTLAIESPQMSNSASFQLNVRQPDSAKITIRGPFGIRVGEALFTGSRFTFYNAINNEVIRGDVLEDGMPGLMDLHIKPEDIYNTLSGTRTFASGETVPDTFRVTDEGYVLVFNHERGAHTRYLVDPASFAITDVQQISAGGETTLEEEYAFSKESDGVLEPETVRILRQESAVLLSYERVKRNTELDPFTIDIPDDARWRSNR